MAKIGFPKGKTALLVIHGIDKKNPFETLDSFARGFLRDMQSLEVAHIATLELGDRVGAGGAHLTERHGMRSRQQS